MMTAPPKVSVLLPVRNGMPFLPAAIDSVLNQTFGDFELIAIDDGSTDGTADYLQQLADRRVRVLSPRTAGLASALNAGLAVARGRYLARQDADDWSAPDRLARQVAWLDDRADVGVLATAASFVNERGEPVDSTWTRAVHAQWDAALAPEQIAKLMPLTCCIFHATVMARTALLRQAGGYDQATVPAEDYDLWLRLLPRHRFARLPERLYTVRIHAASSSVVRRVEQTDRVIEAKLRYVRRQVPGLPWPVPLVLPCNDRGADIFRRVGPSLGYDPTNRAGATATSAAVVAVTDFAALPDYTSTLAETNDYQQFGNVFVRR
jgi:glycosyltransferase involved in cell wall biosynthesis